MWACGGSGPNTQLGLRNTTMRSLVSRSREILSSSSRCMSPALLAGSSADSEGLVWGGRTGAAAGLGWLAFWPAGFLSAAPSGFAARSEDSFDSLKRNRMVLLGLQKVALYSDHAW